MLTRIVFSLIAAQGADPTPRPITQLVHTRWSTEDGAPADIRALAQTGDGYLWVGGVSGLVRFDGIRFVPFVPRGDSVPVVAVRRLLGARDGSLWVVWRNGVVSHLIAGRLTNYDAADGLSATFAVTESSRGELIAATATGLVRFSGGKWKEVGSEWGYPQTEARNVWFDRDDGLWSVLGDRVLHRPARGRFEESMRLSDSHNHELNFAQQADGTVWVADYVRSAYTVPRARNSSSVTEVMVGAWTVAADRNGSIWIGSSGDGLRRAIDPARIRGKRIAQFGREVEHFTEKDGLLSDVVMAMLHDREGNIWVGSSRGLERFREGALSPYVTPGGVRPRNIIAIRDSSVLANAYNVSGLTRFSPQGQDSVASNINAGMIQDSSGSVWAYHPQNTSRLGRSGFVDVPLLRGRSTNLASMTVDRTGIIWAFDSQAGLLRVNGDSVELVAPLRDSVARQPIIYADRKDRIWIGLLDQVAIFEKGQLHVFGPKEGARKGEVRAFYEDREGDVWVVGVGGLMKFEAGRLRSFAQQPDLLGRMVLGLTQDESAAWWLAAKGSLIRLPAGELERALADSSYAVRYRAFDRLDGLPGRSTPGFYPVLVTSRDNRIWIATDGGVAVADPRKLPSNETSPRVLIEVIRANGKELMPYEVGAFPSRTTDLEIDYTATTLSLPERVQFRYRLEGEDDAWRDVGSRRRAYYTGLGPGNYRFRVIASDGDGVWKNAETSLSFHVLPAWYQTRWFQAVVVLLIAGAGAAATFLLQRSRHLRTAEALRRNYEATLTERARIAQDLHDTLLQGFAGVTLQLKTAELALPANPDVAADTIVRVQQLARASLREARARVQDMHDIDLGGGDLPAALDALARERTLGTGIEVAVTSTGDRRRLARSVEDTAFRIGREAIVNALRHAEARRIDIQVEFGSRGLRMQVCDDGRGFTLDEAEDAHKRGHFGLTGARQRAESIGGRCDIRARPRGGTIVDVDLPLPESVER